jgi:hypothetical protein
MEEANRIMVEKKIKKLPVVEPSTNHLLGICARATRMAATS